MSDPILFEINDGVALITLNRPDKLNALNYALIDRLMAALDTIEAEAAVRAVILTGAGERAFSAGADIHEFAGESPRPRYGHPRLRPARTGDDRAARSIQGTRHRSRQRPGVRRRMRDHRGRASGHRQRARAFRQAGNQSRHPPTFGGTQRLPRLAGRKRALELLLTGDPFSPQRALEIGLVNRVVPHDGLLPAARELAARIVRHSPLAVGGIITAVTRGLNMTIGEGLQVENEQLRGRAEQRSRRRHQCLDRAPAASLYRPLTPGMIFSLE